MRQDLFKKGTLILLILSLISACTSMSKEECEVVNWYALGYSSGVKGGNMDRFDSTQQACADYQIKSDFESFNKGYRDGLVKFCTFERGKTIAMSGKSFLSVCPSDEFSPFSKGFEVGKQNYCTNENALSLGKSGQLAGSICPSNEFPDFKSNYQEGLSTFCTYERGHDQGLRGNNALTQCQGPNFDGYDDGYNIGFYQHELETEVKDLQKDLRKISRKLDKLELDITRAEAEIVEQNSTPESRQNSLDKLKYLRLKQQKLKIQQNEHTDRLIELKAELIALKLKD